LTAPSVVSSIMLKSRGSVHRPRVPQLGQGSSVMATESGSSMPLRSAYSSCIWSTRNRLWHSRHSVSGSVNAPTWPDAFQTWLGRMMAESRPTTSSRFVTIARHHWRLMFSLSSTPRGP
jgi:hypothetical protein